MKTSPFGSKTMRFPRRRTDVTRRPSTVSGGGVTDRRTKGLTMRTRSNRWSTTRDSRQST